MDAHCSEQGKDAPVRSPAAPGPLPDLGLLRRLAIVVTLGFLFFAAFVKLDDVYSDKFFDITGNAVWIWPPIEISRELPVAFFASRDFDLPASRYYTKIKIIADPDYTVYFNGHEIGGRRVGEDSTLDVYDVSGLASTGRNRILVAVRSFNGVGGLIAGIDLSPETANYVVTDGRWTIRRQWTPALPFRDTGQGSSPMIIGRPPIGRWNYLKAREVPLEQPPERAQRARDAFPDALSVRTALPVVKEVGGVAIASERPVHATVYDFGPSAGRLRLTRTQDTALTQVIPVRFANTLGEAVGVEGAVRQFVFAGGEGSIVDHEERHFRYVVVYERPAIADVMQQAKR